MSIAEWRETSKPGTPERFMEFVVPEPNSGCWLWIGSAGKGKDQYGWFWNGSRMVGAHRYAYESFVGPIPAGLQIDHLCRVHCCVNPKHLEPVTAAENYLRGMGLPARNKRKTHCQNGHEFNETNTLVVTNEYGKTRRNCRTCTAISRRKHYRQRTPEQVKRESCRSYARTYLRRGKLTRLPCATCGNQDSQMHHSNYDKPLEISWLCRPCHMRLHDEEEGLM